MANKNQQYHTMRKYSDVCKAFTRLSSIKELGVTKYSFEYIIKKLSEQFYLSEDYIARIVREEPKGGYLIIKKNKRK